MTTRLISIGVSRYKHPDLHDLKAAVPDAFRINRGFKNWGITDSSSLISDKQATLGEVKKTLDGLQNDSHFDHLIFYFSGHGKWVEELADSFLCLYDTSCENLSASGLSVKYLINTLQKFSYQKITILIDACSIGIPLLLAEFSQENSIHISWITASPQHEIAFEDDLYYSGDLTYNFLKNLAQTNNRPITTDDILSWFKLSKAEIYFNFCGNVLTRKTLAVEKERHELVNSKLESLIYQNQIIWVYGESGLGKSHQLQLFAKNYAEVVYASISHQPVKNLGVFLEDLALEIAKKSYSFQTDEFSRGMAEKAIRFFASLHPHAILIIDHTNRIDFNMQKQLHSFLKELPCSIILVSCFESKFRKKDLTTWKFPRLTHNETQQILNSNGLIDKEICDLVKNMTGGNYLSLLRSINAVKSSEFSFSYDDDIQKNHLQHAIDSLVSCDGYYDEQAFIDYFSVEKKHLDHLKNLGVLIKIDKFWIPHDHIFELVQYKAIKKLLPVAYKYWHQQVLDFPDSMEINRQFVMMIQLFKPKLDNNFFLGCQILINKLKGRDNTYYLCTLAEYISKNFVVDDIILKVIEQLIDINKFDMATLLVSKINIKELNTHQKTNVCSLKAALAWWMGDFEQCINYTKQGLCKKPMPHAKFDLLTNRGIGFFFLGVWGKASRDLKQVIANKELCRNKRSLLLALFVHGTILALRGINITLGIEQLLESLELMADGEHIVYQSIAYNNLGEIFWKIGEFSFAETYLTKAVDLAFLADNEVAMTEAQRNLLHVYLHQNSSKLENHARELFNLMQQQKENTFTRMQVLNSLAAVYASKQDIRKLSWCLKEVIPLTKNNQEYQIYTLANQSYKLLLQKKIKQAINKLEEALILSKKGKNWLAIKQILEEWNFSARYVQKISELSSTRVFRKWHQMLEKKPLKAADEHLNLYS